MEYKSIKQPICVNETAFNKAAEVPFDVDFNLPDYCPDIMKIFKCRAVARISSKSINGNNVVVDGNITINVIYSDKDGCVYNYEQVSPFSKTIESDTDILSGFACAKVQTEYVNCRAVTERRIDIHGALKLDVSVVIRKKHEIIAEIEQGEIQINRNVVPALNSVGLAEKSLLIDEELTLSDGAEPIESILQYDATALINEVKAIKNKVVVKGCVSVCVMYCSKGHSRYHTYKTTIPYSQFLDMDGVNEECRIEASSELSYLEIRLKKGMDDCKNILINAKLCVLAKAFCQTEVPIISDAFSTKHELLLKKTDIGLENLINSLNDNFMFKTCFDFPMGSICEIVNFWTDTVIKSSKYENNNIFVNGEINLCLLAKDENGSVGYFEKCGEFTYENTYETDEKKNICIVPVFNEISSSYTILSDSRIEFRSEYKVTIHIKAIRKQPLLIDIECEKAEKKKQSNCSMMIYYPDKNESLWDIAKRYNSDINELKRINDINDECDFEVKFLLIPVY